MTLIVPSPCRWEAIYGNTVGVRPSTTQGTSITPGNNTYGSYAQLLAGSAVLTPGYDLAVSINSGAVSAAAKNTIVTLGLDLAGGTTFTDWIIDLLAPATENWPGGRKYHFPIFVPAGASIGAKASVNNATVGTVRVEVKVFAKPTRPEMHRYGHIVQTIGSTPASSSGTAITSGTTSEGAWTSLGTLTKDSWWWQLGFGVNDASLGGASYTADLGFGTTQKVIIEDLGIATSSSENITVVGDQVNEAHEVPGSTSIYGRLQCSGTADSGLSLAAYALR